MPLKDEEIELNQVSTDQKLKQDVETDESAFDKPSSPSHCGFGESLFAIFQLITIILFAIGTEYVDGLHVKTPVSLEAETATSIQNVYPGF